MEPHQANAPSPAVLMDLGRARATLGHRAEAERTLADLRDFGSRVFAVPFHIAVVHGALGDFDRAFAALDGAITARPGT